MTLLDDIRRGTYRADGPGGPPAGGGPFRLTLATVAERVLEGEDFGFCVREFSDEFALRPPGRRQESIDAEPLPTGDLRHDAYLAALAEHLAVRHGLQAPPWSRRPERFLDRFWFVSTTPGFRAVSVAQSPAAFKRRGILIPERSLDRV